MKKDRREFLKLTSKAGIGFASANILRSCASDQNNKRIINKVIVDNAVATLEDGRVVSTPFWRIDSGKD